MGSIFILKPVLDKLHEEVAEYIKQIDVLEVRVSKLCQELDEKNKQIAKLVNENKKIESLLTNYEMHFDTLIHKIDLPAREEDFAVEENNIVKDVDDIKTNDAYDVEMVNKVEKKNTTTDGFKKLEVKQKRDRRDYMREYQRNYRKRQKDVVLNL